mgnify:CR=1 FL=1
MKADPKVKKFLKGKRAMVIGGTGSWGSELVRQLVGLYELEEIRIFSRGEHKQVEMRRVYNDEHGVRYIIGDVRDAQAVDLAMKGVNVVFNLAALKHVPVAEENVWEAVQTNIHGPHNVVTAAMHHGVDVAVQVSTDKAVDPINLYGYTKGAAEKIFTSANYSPSKPKGTRFVCVRGGNVLSTAGSVIPLFKHLIAKHNKLTITDKRMSRYFMRVEEAIGLVLKAMVETVGGEVFVMKMPGAKITDLAEVMKEELGNKSTKIEYIGVRPGEKLYEVLVSKNEAHRTVADGDYYVILPEVFLKNFTSNAYKKHKPIKMEEYNSMNTAQLNKKGILEMLEKDGWLDEENDADFSTLFSPYKENHK